MYKEQTIKFYNQTGFNAIDIPDSPKMLEEKFTPYKTITNANIIQNEFLAYIIVDEFTPEEAQKIDYVVVENPTPMIRNVSCYTIESFEFLADGTCKFNLYLDAYNTLGGFNMDSGNQILGGSAKRMSVSIEEDNVNFFTLEEPFIPSQKYRTEFQKLGLNPDAFAIMPIIETLTIPPLVVERILKDEYKKFGEVEMAVAMPTADPTDPIAYAGARIGENVVKEKISNDVGTVESATYNAMLIPKMRNLLMTIVYLNKADGTRELIESHTRYFDANSINAEATIDGKSIKTNLINDMRAAGRENDLINFWEVPIIYIKETKPQRASEGIKYKIDQEETYGGMESIESQTTKASITITPTTTYNNKARYKQSIEVKVFCAASGEQINKELYEVLADGTSPIQQSFSVSGTILADIRPQGTPIFLFDYSNQVSQLDNMCEHIKGAQWKNIPLAASGISGENVKRAENEAERRIGFLGAAGQGIVGIAMLGAGIASAVVTGGATTPLLGGLITPAALIGSGALSTVGSATTSLNTQAKFKEQENILNQKGVNASSQIQIGNSSYVRDIRRNVFTALITYYSQEDMIAYDTFLTRFGYNVGNRVIKQTDFFSRPAFNFIQINDITIESVLGDINLIDLTKRQLKQGVRIWHKKPNYNDMLAGGNR